MGMVTSDLLATINHNLQTEKESLFQRMVVYDNLPADRIKEIRALTRMQSQLFLEMINTWLSQYDRDVNQNTKGEGKTRAGIGIFYFEDEPDEKNE